jgi:nitrous oxidase accessory protein NosD
MPHRPVPSIALSACVALLALLPRAATAAESYDSCAGFIDSIPATLSTQGVWCLRRDLSSSLASGFLITVATNNVTIDCNGYKIGGLAAGPDTDAQAIVAQGRANTVVRNCNIRGFLVGISLTSDGAVVEDNLLEGITFNGIFVDADDGVVRRNRISDTGRPSGSPSITAAIATTGSTDVIDNAVGGVVSSQDAFGILVYGRSIVRANRVRGILGLGGSYGIHLDNNFPAVVEDNTLLGTSGTAIRCAGDANTAVDNVSVGWSLTVSACDNTGNVVNSN